MLAKVGDRKEKSALTSSLKNTRAKKTDGGGTGSESSKRVKKNPKKKKQPSLDEKGQNLPMKNRKKKGNPFKAIEKGGKKVNKKIGELKTSLHTRKRSVDPLPRN